jgi:hypothetical protein
MKTIRVKIASSYGLPPISFQNGNEEWLLLLGAIELKVPNGGTLCADRFIAVTPNGRPKDWVRLSIQIFETDSAAFDAWRSGFEVTDPSEKSPPAPYTKLLLELGILEIC